MRRPAALDNLALRVEGLRIGQAATAGVNTRLAARPLWHVTGRVPGRCGRGATGCRGCGGRSGPRRRPARHTDASASAGGGTFATREFHDYVGRSSPAMWPAFNHWPRTVRAKLRRAHLRLRPQAVPPRTMTIRPAGATTLPRNQIDEDIAELSTYRLARAGPVTELVLVQSHQGPHPTHVPLHRAPARSLDGCGDPPPWTICSRRQQPQSSTPMDHVPRNRLPPYHVTVKALVPSSRPKPE